MFRFVNHADLMRIGGVGGEYSEPLEAAGVDTVAELARRNAANTETKKVRKLPTEKQVTDWVLQAKALPGIVEY